jgi:hypothetical protein
MKKSFVAILTCMSLSALGVDTPLTSGQAETLVQGQSKSTETTVEKHCERGPRGHRGHRGHKGHRGLIGPQGLSAITEFGEAYILTPYANEAPSPISIPTAADSPVVFTNVGPLSSNVTFDGSSTFTVLTAGTYTIEYAVEASARFTEHEEDEIGLLSLTVKLVGGPTTTTGLTAAPGVEITAPPLTPTVGSYAFAENQITLHLDAGTTIQLLVTIVPSSEQSTSFDPYYGLSCNNEQAAYISISKID